MKRLSRGKREHLIGLVAANWDVRVWVITAVDLVNKTIRVESRTAKRRDMPPDVQHEVTFN